MPGQPQQAREALGVRLREIRLDAGLTARALATLAGWHFTKVGKLEHGTRRPSRDDIRAWCRYCHAEDQATDLIATARSIDAMYTEWRRQMRAGMARFQDSWGLPVTGGDTPSCDQSMTNLPQTGWNWLTGPRAEIP